MGCWLLWGLFATSVLAAFIDFGYGADATWETQGSPTKGVVETLQLYSTTQALRRQRNRTKPYRIGSLSALSRAVAVNVSIAEDRTDENVRHRERDARDPCRGCCGDPFPNHTGSRENHPTKGDSSGHLGNLPTPEPPQRNVTQGVHRPGALSPMGRARRPHQPSRNGQVGFFPGTKWNSVPEASGTHDRCRGCCGRDTTAGAKLPGRREEGRGSQASGGRPTVGVWRPLADSQAPNEPPQMEGKEGFPFSRGAALQQQGGH